MQHIFVALLLMPHFQFHNTRTDQNTLQAPYKEHTSQHIPQRKQSNGLSMLH